MHLPDPLLAVEGSVAKITSIDSPDTDQTVYTVTYLDIFWTVLSIIMRLGNVVLNICLANEYYVKNEFNYFAWTTCCIIIPTLVTACICIQMFVQDRKTSFRKQYTPSEMVLYVVILPFLFRYWQSLSYAIASKRAEKKGDRENQKKFYRYMIEEESDIALIRIFECFLEAAPQKILQISIILAEGIPMTWIQFSAISGSVCSSAYCMAQYHKYNRFTQPDKEQISLVGLIVQCIWHFLITVSRVLCIAVIASAFPLWTLLGFLARVFVTSFILQFFDKPVFCSSTIFHSYAFSFLLGIVYIFTYIIPKEGRTRYRFAVYYVVCVIENIAFVTLYIIFQKSAVKDSIYFIPLCVFSISSYFFGISFMILYYTKCHPNITSRTSLANHEA